jgi:hypothetical protein
MADDEPVTDNSLQPDTDTDNSLVNNHDTTVKEKYLVEHPQVEGFALSGKKTKKKSKHIADNTLQET